jgi:hypothetical protein
MSVPECSVQLLMSWDAKAVSDWNIKQCWECCNNCRHAVPGLVMGIHLLQAGGGTMRLAKLQREAIRAALCGKKARKAVRTQAGKMLLCKLTASKSFIICEDRIQWVSQDQCHTTRHQIDQQA